jgi:hypothetical protein
MISTALPSPYSSLNEGIAIPIVEVVNNYLKRANLGSFDINSLNENFLLMEMSLLNPALAKFSSIMS